jgi:hypothetical protein
VGALFGQVLVKQRHFAGFESLLTVPILEVCVHATGMNDLVRRSESEVKEAWDRDGWDGVGQRHRRADVVYTFQRVTRQVQVLLGPNDVDFLAVVESLANERDVHETEKGDVAASQLLWTPESVLGLPVKGSLAEYRAD